MFQNPAWFPSEWIYDMVFFCFLRQAGSQIFADQKACLLFPFVLFHFFSSGLPHILWFVERLHPNSYIKPWGSLWDQFKGIPFIPLCSGLNYPSLTILPGLLFPLGCIGLCSEPASSHCRFGLPLLVASQFLACFAFFFFFLFTNPFCICLPLKKKQQPGKIKTH